MSKASEWPKQTGAEQRQQIQDISNSALPKGRKGVARSLSAHATRDLGLGLGVCDWNALSPSKEQPVYARGQSSRNRKYLSVVRR